MRPRYTMEFEKEAYSLSLHREARCAERHIAPGIEGPVEAEMNQTKQVIEEDPCIP